MDSYDIGAKTGAVLFPLLSVIIGGYFGFRKGSKYFKKKGLKKIKENDNQKRIN